MAATIAPIKNPQSPGKLPDGWRTVRFGDVVRNVDVYVSNPLEADLERYIGLDHLDPESLHIKRWGLIADGTSFTRKFTKGQVLFGKRRAYQRKAAVADFDGICSGDILVFEPQGDDLLPDLLPFIVQSEGFYKHALGTSAGSLSPRTRWRDLAKYEFPLPPKPEQRRIADVLWAADNALNAMKRAGEALVNLRPILFSKSLEAVLKNRAEGQKPMETAVREVIQDIQYGISKPSGIQTPDSVPILRIPNVVKGYLDLSDLTWINLTVAERDQWSVQEGDILIVRTNGNPNYVGRNVVIEEALRDWVYASYLIRVRLDKSRILPAYLHALLDSDRIRKTLNYEIRSSAGNYNLNTEGIRKQRIPLPTLSEQNRLVEMLKQLDTKEKTLDTHIERLDLLRKSLIRYLLRGLPQVS